MRILLIRHGEPDYEIDSLTEKGKREAELLSRRMERYDIRDFYVSPLGRARDTAAYTLERMHREAEVLPWLKEFSGKYPDPETGKLRLAWDNKPRIWTAFPGVWDYHTFLDNPLFDRGDFRQVWQETEEGVRALMARYGFRKDGPVWLCDHNTPDTIALFCHFGVTCVMLSHLWNVSPFVPLQFLAMAPTSLTEVVTEEREKGIAIFRTLRIGDITHLTMGGEKPSFSARFCERYENEGERH